MKNIRLLATLRDLVGEPEIAIPLNDGQTVRDLLQLIRERYPALGAKMADADGNLTGLVHIFIGGRNIQWLEGLDTPIHESDELILIPPVAGG